MKRALSAIFAALGWFALVTQYVLMLEHQTESPVETTIRFFSFFTILTNIIVALYYSLVAAKPTSQTLNKPGTLTAITLYMTIVGLVYQVMLRPAWDAHGIQKIVDEVLHSVIPILTIFYWILFEKRSGIRYSQIFPWMIYPLIYFVYVLIRGASSDFYPYPFIDVNALGYQKVLISAVAILVLFVFSSFAFVAIARNLLPGQKVSRH
jgi:hypothetical protein